MKYKSPELKKPSYVLITPARNEEAYIEKTIQSVISQTVLPVKWVIVSDRSTDRTDEIVNSYVVKHTFIQLVTVSSDGKLNFGSKVKAINEGYKCLQDVTYEFIGNLDADVSFDTSYYQEILGEFEKNQRLGIAGGIIQELIKDQYVTQNISLNSVAGAVQLFHRQCYEAVGGYIPLEYGGIDAAVEILARMKGWQVKTFPEYKVLHHRRVTSGGRSIISTRFYQGLTNYLLGYHPVFHIMSCLFRITDRPFFLGSLSSISGYSWAFLRKYKRKLPENAVKYLRSEQMKRLKVSILNRKRA